MLKVKHILFSIVVTFSLLIINGTSVTAADVLPPGFLVGDDTGVKAGTDGEYFLSDNDIFPGKKFTRKITLSNYSNEKGSYSIKLVMNPNDSEKKPEVIGEVNLLEAISVKLIYQNKTIYEGTIDGNGTPIANKKSMPIDLGKLEVGESRVIDAEFKVASDSDIEDWRDVNSSTFYWLFYANRESNLNEEVNNQTPTKKVSGKLPQTGEIILTISALLSALMLVLLLLIFKKKKLNR